MLAIMCWVLRDQLLAISNSELDEVADDKVALDQKQRDIALAQVSADMLSNERTRVRLHLGRRMRGEVIDFRADTTPMAVLGVALRTVPRVKPSPGTSPDHAWTVRR